MAEAVSQRIALERQHSVLSKCSDGDATGHCDDAIRGPSRSQSSREDASSVTVKSKLADQSPRCDAAMNRTKQLVGTNTNGHIDPLRRIPGHELGTERARDGHKAKRQPFGLAFTTALGRVFPSYSVVARAGFISPCNISGLNQSCRYAVWRKSLSGAGCRGAATAPRATDSTL